jgi:hypothetical protein
MKRVRNVATIATVAGVTPALGLFFPAAHHSAASAHTEASKSVKTVSVSHLRDSRVAADTNCGSKNHQSSHSPSFKMTTYYTDTCVRRVYGHLDHAQGSLLMRTRVYRDKANVYSKYVTGTQCEFTCSSTHFTQSPINQNGVSLVCAALVSAPHRGTVLYGPLCTGP